ncbi:hypothetical protein Tco_0477280 [Tanacetum coccineum]
MKPKRPMTYHDWITCDTDCFNYSSSDFIDVNKLIAEKINDEDRDVEDNEDSENDEDTHSAQEEQNGDDCESLIKAWSSKEKCRDNENKNAESCKLTSSFTTRRWASKKEDI